MKAPMANTAENQRPLMLEPKAMKTALKHSAEKAQRMASGFGQKVPVALGRALAFATGRHYPPFARGFAFLNGN